MRTDELPENARKRLHLREIQKTHDAGKVPRRKERVVPWKELYGLLDPFYLKADKGRSSVDLEWMLRIHFLQSCFHSAGIGAEEALDDLESMRLFYGMTFLFDAIGEQLGITEDLKRYFPKTFRQVLFVANYLVLEDKNPLCRFEKWNALHKRIPAV